MTALGRRGHRIREIGVVVPARNESALIDRCLAALVAARAHLATVDPLVTVGILVVADACTDGTEDVVRARRDDRVELLVTDAGRVGAARAVGVRAVLGDRAAHRLDRLWLAHTDADSVVPVEWLAQQVALAEAGAEVVVGTVRPDPADLTAEQDARWLATHERGRPNGHVHGANLGVLASAYVQAGGFDAVPEHEDNLLVDRLRSAGARIVASDDAEVLTSGRRIGRTPGGYAAYLEGALGASPAGASPLASEAAS